MTCALAHCATAWPQPPVHAASPKPATTSRLFAERDNRMRMAVQPMRHTLAASRLGLPRRITLAILSPSRQNRPRFAHSAIYATAWPQPSVHAASLQPQAASSPSVTTGCASLPSPCAKAETELLWPLTIPATTPATTPANCDSAWENRPSKKRAKRVLNCILRVATVPLLLRQGGTWPQMATGHRCWSLASRQ